MTDVRANGSGLDDISRAPRRRAERQSDGEVEGEAEWTLGAGNGEEQEDEASEESDGIASDDSEEEGSSDEVAEGGNGMAINDFFVPSGSRRTRAPRQTRLTDAESAANPKRKSRKRKSDRSPRGERARNRRRTIADVMDDEELDDSTLKAREAEAKRAQRIDAILGNFSALSEEQLAVGSNGDAADVKEQELRLCLNLATDGNPPKGEEGTEDAPIFVHKDIVGKLKKHQVVGARFLWSHIAVEPDGFGCVLADFMGLGKTLQVITIVQAFLTQKRLDSDGYLGPRHKHVLILAPTICVRNWEAEVVKWLGKKEARRLGLQTLESSREKKMTDRVHVVKQWHKRGGILIMGYELYRLLVLQSSGDEKIAAGNQKYAHLIKQVYPYLSDPGPDLIVLDEGHRVRDHKSKLVKALAHVKTARRIILTGYPLQNHLEEYWTMVNFARPDYLGSLDEFKNRFVDPIQNAQCVDSSETDLRLARQRAFVLTRELKPLVLRRDQQYLFKQLPPKKEYVLMCKLTDPQANLYRAFLQNGVPKRGGEFSDKVDVLGGYHISLAISNHPDVLRETFKQLQEDMYNGVTKKSTGAAKNRRYTSSLFGVEDGDDDYDFFADFPSSASTPAESRGTRVVGDSSDEGEVDLLNALDAAPRRAPKPVAALSAAQGHRLSFAQDFMDSYVASQLESSGKMMILMQILSECQDIGDRVIVFSQSIPTLNTIALMIAKHNKYQRRHSKRLSYLRIDGSTAQQDRFRQIAQFNDLEEDVDLIMISTKAGGEGINLCAGNRIIIFDVCWNPCNDSQSMCRSYRFGQTKPVFVYRFVTAGTMEKKVYDLQIRKEGVAKRIVDEKTMERKFKSTELQNYFDVEDFEQSLHHAQGKKVDDEVQEVPQEDSVLEHLLVDMQDGATTSLPGKGCIVEWFEQETMFEEDLDQQCSPAEQKEILESYTYLKAVRRMNKRGSHLISREGVLVVQCEHCRVMNEIYPTSTTKVPVPSKIECSYCKRPTITSGATAAPENPSPGYPFRGFVPGYPMPLPGATPALAPSSAMVDAGATPAAFAATQSGKILPPHLQILYQQQQLQHAKVAEQERMRAFAAADAQSLERQRAELQRRTAEEEAKRRTERLAMKLSDRHMLVLRRGVKGCQDLKRKAEECGATMAIEVNSQLTDVISAMSKEETLRWLKLTKLPRDVDLHDDTWLRNEIAKEKGLPLISPAGDSSASALASASTSDGSGSIPPKAATPSSTGTTSDGLSPQTTADTSSDFIELLDSDDEMPPKSTIGIAVATQNGAGGSNEAFNVGMDDDDDVIEIM
ncbi:hypothetical protein BBJ28_00006197 [Nothophytophthora sp. Chile5]|nr:hypothetical protein BBJ28_00006197 [Nothophytophthora sp. Chile5]